MKGSEIRERVRELGDPVVAQGQRRFFKTGPGEYGEGDVFAGVKVPALRRLAREYRGIGLEVAEELLQSPVHEERLLALLILVAQFPRSDEAKKRQIHDLYLRNTRHVNNWDLVDSSAPYLVGAFLEDKDRSLPRRLARSGSLWERRIAMICTFAWIKKNQFTDALEVAEILLGDREDLIQKAVGWMLKEIGERDLALAERFLEGHYRKMPRTMLRYAIEKFPEPRRQQYLKGQV